MMKRLSLLVFCLAALTAQAQTIPNGSEWFDGFNTYEASRQDGGKIQFYSMNEGEETIYMLTPVSGKSGQWTMEMLSDVPEPGDYLDLVAKYVQQDGITALTVYQGNRLVDLFEKKSGQSGRDMYYERWLPTLTGTYNSVDADGNISRIVIGEKTFTVDGTSARYEVPTLNDYPFDVLDVKGGPWQGCWHFVRTATGLNAYRSELNEYSFFDEVDDTPVVLTWADPDRGRWDFASKVFIRPGGYTKATLRVMRNAILAKHGYVFQSEDLKRIFESQLWYEPVSDNSAIKLSFIEQMNIARIQTEEAKDDLARWISEEEPGVKREH